MGTQIQIQRYDVRGTSKIRHLWEILFDHHVSIGAAGLATIARHESWPRRLKHYEGLFEQYANGGIWIASLENESLGYAMAYEDELEGDRVMILETLSVLPSARGQGIGTRLMNAVDGAAREAGIKEGAVDVMGGNPRARELYLRHGYAPYSESWMRSTPPASFPSIEVDAEGVAETAQRLGLQLSIYSGPDDTWESSDCIVELSAAPSSTWLNSPAVATIREEVSERVENTRPLAALFSSLGEAGLWTIRFELPCAPDARELRAVLQDQGFHLSTERLTRTL